MTADTSAGTNVLRAERKVAYAGCNRPENIVMRSCKVTVEREAGGGSR